MLFVPFDDEVESYAKQRLVPFSEYAPALAAWLAPLLGRVTQGRPYSPGAQATVLRRGGLPFAAPICFEVTDPALMRRFRAAGAQLFVNLSNDAWFGRSGYAESHLRHAVLRAVELRSWVVRGANTGISAVIDTRGRVVAELGLVEEGTLATAVASAPPPSLYARVGSAPMLGFLALVLAVSVLAGRRGGAPARGVC